MYARLAATLHALTGTEALRHAVAPQDPYAAPDEFLADLRIIETSLQSHHAQALVAPRLAPLMRAVQVFGFHLATVDLRQSSDQHEAVVAELLRVARIEPDYAVAAAKRRAARCCWRCWPTRRRCACAAPPTRQLAQSELAVFEAAREARRRYGRGRSATTSSRTPKR